MKTVFSVLMVGAALCAIAAETDSGLGQTDEPQNGLRHLKVWQANGGGQPVVDAATSATNGAFRIMSYNVRFGKGMDGVRDYKRTARCILSEGPDFVCVQEIWNWKEFTRLAGYLGMYGAFANSRHFLGNAVFSREKPIRCEAVELPYSKKMGRTLVISEYKDFVVASMHLDLDVNKRKESVSVVKEVLEKYSKPVFIAGDWNNWPQSPVLKGLKKFVNVISPEKNIHTWHARTMKRKEAVIDYIAVDKAHAMDFSVVRSYEVPDRTTSDHSPIVVELKPAEKDALTSDASSGTGFALGAVLAYDTLISHRGESVDAPENTLPAYKMAVERGFGFECDVYLSNDGRVFTFHDKTLTRTTGGANTNKCGDVTWDEISKVDVGSWGKWKGSKFKGTRPALLEEVLALARDGRWLYIDVKSKTADIVPHVKAIFDKQKKANPKNTLFLCGSLECGKAFKKLMPEYKVLSCLNCCRGWENGAPPEPVENIISTTREMGADGVDLRFVRDVTTSERERVRPDCHRYAKQSSAELIAEGAIS